MLPNAWDFRKIKKSEDWTPKAMNPTSESSERIKKFARENPFSNLANHVEVLIYAWKLTVLWQTCDGK